MVIFSHICQTSRKLIHDAIGRFIHRLSALFPRTQIVTLEGAGEIFWVFAAPVEHKTYTTLAALYGWIFLLLHVLHDVTGLAAKRFTERRY